MKDNISIQLNRESKEPMYMQLYMALKGLIESGGLIDGERLPSIRSLSRKFQINNVTVVNAYRLLENSGYAYSKSGSGTYVIGKALKNEHSSKQEKSIRIFNEEADRKGCINFAESSPDPELFPVQDFKDVLNKILERDGGSAFGYTEVKGYPPLRQCICHMMHKYNVKCGMDDILIVSGAQQGIDIIAKAMIDYRDIIITERPTYTGAIAVFKSRGAAIFDIPINRYGLDTALLEDRLKFIHPKFIYVMPNYQNPTGFSYSENNMNKLLYLAEKYDFYIIEDDYLSDLYYDNKQPQLLKSYDTSGRVILIKSFSKIFMPGMRIGFMIMPDVLRQRIEAAKHLSDISTSGFIQRIFEMYIRENMIDRHIINIRQKYKLRYDAIISSINRHISGVRYYRPEGGIHLWLRLPEGLSSNMLYSQCIESNILISPGASFYLDKNDSDYIRLNFASTPVDEIERGIEILGGIIYKLSGQE